MSMTFLMSACSISNLAPKENNAPLARDTMLLKTQNAHQEDLKFVVYKETAYYVEGPWQGRSPDGMMREGTPLKILKDIGSYSLVETSMGLKAYVLFDDLRQIQ